MSVRSHYDVLGVGYDADRDAIRRAWRVRLLLLHPDRHAGAPEDVRIEAAKETLLVNEAWGVLKDERKRRDYDRLLSEFRTDAEREVDLPKAQPGARPVAAQAMVRVACARCKRTKTVPATTQRFVCDACKLAWRFEKCQSCGTFVRCDERDFGRRWRCRRCRTINLQAPAG